MAYVARNITDRIALGDDKFTMETLPDGRIQLIPVPDEIIEQGTDVNRALLQPIENNVVWLINRVISIYARFIMDY